MSQLTDAERFAGMLVDQDVYPGYPLRARRKRISGDEYRNWVKEGRPAGITVGVDSHKHYLDGLKKGKAIGPALSYFDVPFAESFLGPYERDDLGRPVHPYAEELLLTGLAVEGLGYYYTFGPNLAVDPIVVGKSNDGYLKIVVIRRRDTGRMALPGGHLDKGERPEAAALRELREETDIWLKNGTGVLVYRGPVPDTRLTLNAWPETSAFLFIVDDIDSLKPVAGDDAKEAEIVVANEAFFKSVHPGHAQYVCEAICMLREKCRWEVDFDGRVC
ncbi:NUDIX domain-containing protein [Candidatus Saccharibacteria bacterium]|nr:NUDIX domain-containing protein [Candidatus Saccharibacteria bacterium]